MSSPDTSKIDSVFYHDVWCRAFDVASGGGIPIMAACAVASIAANIAWELSGQIPNEEEVEALIRPQP